MDVTSRLQNQGLKYEKFLLTNQIDAPTFERRLKERELQNNLFNFISGGIYSPLFLTKKLYENETKKIEIEYIDLKEIYGSKDSIKNNDVNKYIPLHHVPFFLLDSYYINIFHHCECRLLCFICVVYVMQ